MQKDRLFRSVYGYQATFRLTATGWWALIVDTFYEGEPWSIDDRRVYERLSLAECAEVLLAEISVARP